MSNKHRGSSFQSYLDECREERMRELHLIFATKLYNHTFDESKMTDKEIKQKREQIPTLGIVPFDAGYMAGYKDGLGESDEG